MLTRPERRRRARPPVLPGLFDAPTRAQANTARDRAITAVTAHAEATRQGFLEAARDFIRRYLAAHGPTRGELLTVECKNAGIVPPDDRAFGPVYLSLVRRREIEPAGEVRRERGHGTAGGHIYRLMESRR
jgi:hypothetical protein